MSERKHRYGRWSKVPTRVKKQLLISFYLTIVITLATTIFYFLAQPEIPIFYTLPLDEQIIAPKAWVFLLPGISFGITLLHMIIFGLLYDLDTLVLQLFAQATMIMQGILVIALFRVIMITW